MLDLLLSKLYVYICSILLLIQETLFFQFNNLWNLQCYVEFDYVLVEKKRIQRMKRAGKDKPTMETYESLVSYGTLRSKVIPAIL